MSECGDTGGIGGEPGSTKVLRCPECQSQIIEDKGNCMKCGVELTPQLILQAKEASNIEKKRSMIWGLLFWPLIFISLYGVFSIVSK